MNEELKDRIKQLENDLKGTDIYFYFPSAKQ